MPRGRVGGKTGNRDTGQPNRSTANGVWGLQEVYDAQWRSSWPNINFPQGWGGGFGIVQNPASATVQCDDSGVVNFVAGAQRNTAYDDPISLQWQKSLGPADTPLTGSLWLADLPNTGSFPYANALGPAPEFSFKSTLNTSIPVGNDGDPYYRNVTLLTQMNASFNDASLNKIDLYAVGAVTTSTDTQSGDNSVRFDGKARLSVPPSSVNALNDFTIEFWVKGVGTGGTNNTLMAAYGLNGKNFGTGGAAAGSWAIFNYNRTVEWYSWEPPTQLIFRIQNADASSSTDLATGVNVLDNTWHHVAVTRTGTTLAVYVDGIRRVTNTNVTTVTLPKSTQTAVIGASVLLLNFNGTDGSTTFVDSGTNNLAVTRIGNPTISTTQSKFGGASGYFDGSSYVSVPTSSNFDFSTGDFTIEGWVYKTGSSYNGIIASRNFGVGHGWCLYIAPDGRLGTGSVRGYSGYSDVQLHPTPIAANTWTHFAVVKTAAGYTAYINGVAGPLLSGGGFQYLSTLPIVVGAVSLNGELPFSGYLDDIRVTKGTAVYTADFTPPTAALSPLSGVGAAQISTTQSKFGGASGYFNGTTGLTVLDRLNLGAGDFTIECWLYPTVSYTNGSSTTLFSGSASGTGALWGLGFATYNGYNGLSFTYDQYGSFTCGLTTDWWPVTNTWQHIAVVRSNGNIAIYVDGVAKTIRTYNENNTFNPATNFTNTTVTQRVIGAGLAGESPFTGYMDEVRITVGVARYTTNFTPATSPFPDYGGNDANFSSVTLLLHMNGTAGATNFIDSSGSPPLPVPLTAVDAIYVGNYNTANFSGGLAGVTGLVGKIDGVRISSVARYTAAAAISPTTFSTSIVTDPDFASVVFLLAVNSPGTVAGIVDKSPTPKTITISPGSVGLNSTNPAINGYADFNATADSFLVIPETESQKLKLTSTSDFTIEAWIFLRSASQGATIITEQYIYPRISYAFGVCNPNGQDASPPGQRLFFGSYWYGWTTIVSTADIPLNQWVHVAVVRKAETGICTLFINGVASGSGVNNSTALDNPANKFYIGRRWVDTGTADRFDGLIDSIRITKNVARYSSNFTPPTTDPAYEKPDAFGPNTLVHVNFETGINDVSGNNVISTLSSSAFLTSSQRKFVNRSFTSGNLALRGDFRLTGSFTIEGWFYFGSTTTKRFLYSSGTLGYGLVDFFLENGRLYFQPASAGVQSFSSNAVITDNAWQHIAFVRDTATLSDQIRCFVNGVLIGSVTYSDTLSDTVTYKNTFFFANSGDYVGEVRVTAAARYGVNGFDLPLAAWTPSRTETSLTVSRAGNASVNGDYYPALFSDPYYNRRICYRRKDNSFCLIWWEGWWILHEVNSNGDPAGSWQYYSNSYTWIPVSEETPQQFATPAYDTLTLTPTLVDNATYYRLKAVSGFQTAFSERALLTIEPLDIRFTTQPVNQTAVNGSATFTAIGRVYGRITGIEYTSGLSYQWQKQLPNSTTWTNVVGQTGSSLVVSGVVTGDTGSKFRVRFGCGTTNVGFSEAATLTVA